MFGLSPDVAAALTALAFDLGITVVLQYLEYARRNIFKQVVAAKCFENINTLRKELEDSSNKIIKYGRVIGALKIMFRTNPELAKKTLTEAEVYGQKFREGSEQLRINPISLEIANIDGKVEVKQPLAAKLVFDPLKPPHVLADFPRNWTLKNDKYRYVESIIVSDPEVPINGIGQFKLENGNIFLEPPSDRRPYIISQVPTTKLLTHLEEEGKDKILKNVKRISMIIAVLLGGFLLYKIWKTRKNRNTEIEDHDGRKQQD